MHRINSAACTARRYKVAFLPRFFTALLISFFPLTASAATLRQEIQFIRLSDVHRTRPFRFIIRHNSPPSLANSTYTRATQPARQLNKAATPFSRGTPPLKYHPQERNGVPLDEQLRRLWYRATRATRAKAVVVAGVYVSWGQGELFNSSLYCREIFSGCYKGARIDVQFLGMFKCWWFFTVYVLFWLCEVTIGEVEEEGALLLMSTRVCMWQSECFDLELYKHEILKNSIDMEF